MSKLIQIIICIIGLLLIITGLLIFGVFPMMPGGPVLVVIGLAAVIFYVAINYKEIMESISVRSAKYGTNTFVFVVVVFLIALTIYSLGSTLRLKLDGTMFKENSLSDQSVQIAKNQKSNVEIFGFVTRKDIVTRELFRKECDMYRYASGGKIFCRLVDPDEQPVLARKFGVNNSSEKVYGFQAGSNLAKTRFLTEEDFTSSLIKITQDTKKYIYFTSGHGEGNIRSENDFEFKKLILKLEDNNYKVMETFLPKEPEVPENCSVLVLLSPKSNFIDDELKKIDAYLNKGGSVLILVDPLETTGLEKFLASWGLDLRNDIVADTASNINQNPTVLLVSFYRKHPITTVSRGQLQQTFFSEARSITPNKRFVKDLNAPEMLFFTTGGYQYSFSETDVGKYEKDGILQYEPDTDFRGPISIAWAVTKTLDPEPEPAKDDNPDDSNKNKDLNNKPESTLEQEAQKEKKSTKKPQEAKLVVIGDSDFINNKYLDFYGNLDLVLNTINWLAGDENLISIDRASAKPNIIRLTPPTRKLIYYVYFVLVPFVIFLTGFVIWWKKRK